MWYLYFHSFNNKEIVYNQKRTFLIWFHTFDLFIVTNSKRHYVFHLSLEDTGCLIFLRYLYFAREFIFNVIFLKKSCLKLYQFIIPDSNETKPNMCRHCHQYLLMNESILLEHCRSCKAMSRSEERHRHVCYTCNYSVRNAWQMKNHIRRHLGNKPFQCDLCEYRATKRNLLMYHYKKHEQKVKKITVYKNYD